MLSTDASIGAGIGADNEKYRLPDVQVVTKTQIHRNFSKDQKLQIVKEVFGSGMSIAALQLAMML